MYNKQNDKMSKFQINKVAILIGVAYFTAMMLVGCSSTQQCPQTYGYDNYRPQRANFPQ